MLMNTADAFPSVSEIQHYREHGWIVSPAVIPDEVIDEALFGAQRMYAGERDWKLPVAGGYLDWKPDHGDGLRINDYASLQVAELQRLIVVPDIGRIAAKLAGCEIIRLFHDQLICKPPGHDAPVGWHVDKSYWDTCSHADAMLTAWIPLQDCTLESGTLTFIDGSHQWTGNDWMATFTEKDLVSLERRFTTNGQQIEKKPALLKKGQVSFHHCRTIHGGTANRSDQPRFAVALHMQTGANRFRPAKDKTGKPIVHMNDVLCRRGDDGAPDYSDRDICPVLWPITK